MQTFEVIKLNIFQYRQWAVDLDEGRVPDGFQSHLEEIGAVKQENFLAE